MARLSFTCNVLLVIVCLGAHSGRGMRNCVHAMSTTRSFSMRTTISVTYFLIFQSTNASVPGASNKLCEWLSTQFFSVGYLSNVGRERNEIWHRDRLGDKDDAWAALQIHDRSPKSRPVASLNQSQTQLTRPLATGLGLQRDPELRIRA